MAGAKTDQDVDALLYIGQTIGRPIIAISIMFDHIKGNRPGKAAEAAAVAARYFERRARNSRNLARALRHMESERC